MPGCSVTLNGTFSAPHGIPDNLKPSSLKIVISNVDTLEKFEVPLHEYGTSYDSPDLAAMKDEACWKSPSGCPLTPRTRLSIPYGTYRITIEGETRDEVPVPVILSYYKQPSNPSDPMLGTHTLELATKVPINDPTHEIRISPTIEMNCDHVP